MLMPPTGWWGWLRWPGHSVWSCWSLFWMTFQECSYRYVRRLWRQNFPKVCLTLMSSSLYFPSPSTRSSASSSKSGCVLSSSSSSPLTSSFVKAAAARPHLHPWRNLTSPFAWGFCAWSQSSSSTFTAYWWGWGRLTGPADISQGFSSLNWSCLISIGLAVLS